MKQITLILISLLSGVHASDIKCIEPSGGSSRCVIVMDFIVVPAEL